MKLPQLGNIKIMQIILSTTGFAIAGYLTIDWKFDRDFLEYPLFTGIFLLLLISTLLIKKK